MSVPVVPTLKPQKPAQSEGSPAGSFWVPDLHQNRSLFEQPVRNQNQSWTSAEVSPGTGTEQRVLTGVGTGRLAGLRLPVPLISPGFLSSVNRAAAAARRPDQRRGGAACPEARRGSGKRRLGLQEEEEEEEELLLLRPTGLLCCSGRPPAARSLLLTHPASERINPFNGCSLQEVQSESLSSHRSL